MRRALTVGLAWLVAGCTPVLYAATRLRASGSRRVLPLEATVHGSTEHGDGRFRPSCNGGGGEGTQGGDDVDNVWQFTPDARGEYEFRTHAEYDTVLAVYQTGGDEPELACNDDDGAQTDSRVRVTLDAHRTYSVVVSGFRSDHGAYELIAERRARADADAAVQRRRAEEAEMQRCRDGARLAPGLTAGALGAADRPSSITCGRGGNTAVFRFDVLTSQTVHIEGAAAFGVAMELRVGCGNDARVLACEQRPPTASEAVIDATLEAGAYALFVQPADGASTGAFALRFVTQDVPVCASARPE